MGIFLGILFIFSSTIYILHTIPSNSSLSSNINPSEELKFRSTDLLNATFFNLMAKYNLNMSDYEQVRDMEAFDFLGWHRNQIVLISSIWNETENHKGLIQVFDYYLKYYNQTTLLDSLVLSNSSGDLDLFEVVLYDIDSDNVTEILVTGGVLPDDGMNQMAFLMVYNLTEGNLLFEWEKWWSAAYVDGGVTGNSLVLTDFDKDGIIEICTVTSTYYMWDNYQNVIRFWNYSNHNLALENTYDFGTDWFEMSWSIDEGVIAADYDKDNRPELLIFTGHASSEADDSADLFALNYTGSALTIETSRSWQISIYGTSMHGIYLGDYDGDTELEILAKLEYRTNLNVPQAHYKMLNYSNGQFNEEFAATYTQDPSTAHLPGSWLPKNFDSDPTTEFISSDWYGNSSAFLRVWDYQGYQLQNSELKSIAIDCKEPPLIRFLHEGFPLFIAYSQNDTVGFNLYFAIYGQPDNEPPISNAPSGGIYAANTASTYSKWILTDNYQGGHYRILINNSVHVDWTLWTSGTNLTVPVDTNRGGSAWNYSIQYNDSVGLWGNPNTVIIIVDCQPPTFTTVTESAEPLELGRTETITIAGVADPSGIQLVRIAFEGANHTMSDLGGGIWRYSAWIPNSTGPYPYKIYIQDMMGNWTIFNGAIQVVDTTPPTFTTVTESADPLELGRTATITISGVADLSGIQTVLIEFWGGNDTMAYSAGTTWRSATWIPATTGTHSYTIYIQDNAGNWKATTGSIQVVSTSTDTIFAYLIPFLIIGAVLAASCVIVICLLFWAIRAFRPRPGEKSLPPGDKTPKDLARKNQKGQ